MALAEFGHVGWPFFGQIVLAVANDMDLDGGPSVWVVGQTRKYGPEKVLAVGEQQGTSAGPVCLAL